MGLTKNALDADGDLLDHDAPVRRVSEPARRRSRRQLRLRLVVHVVVQSSTVTSLLRVHIHEALAAAKLFLHVVVHVRRLVLNQHAQRPRQRQQ